MNPASNGHGTAVQPFFTAPGTRHPRCKRAAGSNVEGSFQCNTGLSGEAVILVDDVATTGSILSVCAAALKDAGAGSVWGLTVAREV